MFLGRNVFKCCEEGRHPAGPYLPWELAPYFKMKLGHKNFKIKKKFENNYDC